MTPTAHTAVSAFVDEVLTIDSRVTTGARYAYEPCWSKPEAGLTASAGPKGGRGATDEGPGGMGAQAQVYKTPYPLAIVH
jgi:hypothetical protein